MKRTSVALTVMVACLVGAFAVFVWPTPYRSIAILPPQNVGGQHVFIEARQNRFNGDVEWLPLLNYRFISGGDLAASSGTKASDPSDELERLYREAVGGDRWRRAALWTIGALAALGLALAGFFVIRSRRGRLQIDELHNL